MVEAEQFSFLSVGSDKVVQESSSQLGLRKHLKLCFVSRGWCLLMSLSVILAERVKVAPRSRGMVYFSSGGDVFGT